MSRALDWTNESALILADELFNELLTDIQKTIDAFKQEPYDRIMDLEFHCFDLKV